MDTSPVQSADKLNVVSPILDISPLVVTVTYFDAPLASKPVFIIVEKLCWFEPDVEIFTSTLFVEKFNVPTP